LAYQERIAKLVDLYYIALEGNIGVICNSAGECMATNDLIIQIGGRPANFLDLGGQAYHEQIEEIIDL
jgi:succinyl-CoA synthetase beta subunit